MIPNPTVTQNDIKGSNSLFVLKEWLLIIGMVAILALIPISWLGPGDVPKMYTVYAVVILCLGMDIISRRRYALGLVELVLLAFVMWHFLSYTWTAFPGLVWYEAFHWVMLLGIYLVVRNFDYASANKNLWIKAFIGVMIFNYVILTYFHTKLYIDNPWGASANYLNTNTRRFFGHNCNYLSSLLVIALPVVIYLTRKLRIHPGLATLMVGTHSFFLLICNSRASVIAWFLVVLVLTWQYGFHKLRRYIKWAIPLCIGLVIAFTIIIYQPLKFISLYNPITSLSERSADDRTDLWDKSIKLIKESPVRGHGSNSWKVHHLRFGSHNISRSYNGRFQYNHAHNTILETGAELGLPGILALLSLFILPFYLHYSRKSKGKDSFHKYVLLGFLAYIVISSFYQVTYTNRSQFGSLDLMFVCLLGLITSGTMGRASTRWFAPPILVLMLASFTHHVYVHSKLSELTDTFRGYQQKDPLQVLGQFNQIYHPIFFQYNDYVPLKKLESRLLHDTGNTAEAIQIMIEAITLHPYHIRSWELLGDMYLELGNLKGAKDSYAEIMHLNEWYIEARVKLANVSLRDEDWQMFDKALSYYPEWISPDIQGYQKDPFTIDHPHSAYWMKLCNYESQVFKLEIDKGSATQQVNN